MMKGKWLLAYFVVTGMIGFVGGGGVFGAMSLCLFAPGALLDAMLGGRPGHHNLPLMLFVSILYWLVIYASHKARSKANEVAAPREMSISRQRKVEVWED